MYTGTSTDDILLNPSQRANTTYNYITNTADDESYNIALEDYKIFLTEVDDNISSLTSANIELLEVYDSIQNSQVSLSSESFECKVDKLVLNREGVKDFISSIVEGIKEVIKRIIELFKRMVKYIIRLLSRVEDDEEKYQKLGNVKYSNESFDKEEFKTHIINMLVFHSWPAAYKHSHAHEIIEYIGGDLFDAEREFGRIINSYIRSGNDIMQNLCHRCRTGYNYPPNLTVNDDAFKNVIDSSLNQLDDIVGIREYRYITSGSKIPKGKYYTPTHIDTLEYNEELKKFSIQYKPLAIFNTSDESIVTDYSISPGDFKTAIRHVTEDKNIDFHSVRLAAKATYGRIKTSIANTEKLGDVIDEELQKLYSGVDTFVQDLTEDNQILMVKAWSEYVASISKAAKVTMLLYTIRIKDGITAMRKYYNLLEQI